MIPSDSIQFSACLHLQPTREIPTKIIRGRRYSGLPATQELSALEMSSCRISEKPVRALPSRLQRIVCCLAGRLSLSDSRPGTVPSI